MADVPIWALGGHSRATKDALISMRDRSGIAVPESVWRTKAAIHSLFRFADGALYSMCSAWGVRLR